MTQAATDEAGNDWEGELEPAEVEPGAVMAAAPPEVSAESMTAAALAIAEGFLDAPLDDDVLTAAADVELPPKEWFEDPQLPGPTEHTVEGRRVFGHLARWDIPHIGIDGKPVYAPRNRSGYRWFHTKSARVAGEDGPERLRIGHITFHRGHAPVTPGYGFRAAAAHYDNSAARGAKVRMGEDDYGIWYAGALVSGIEGPALEEFEESDTSGDWREILGKLELVAALCVNVGGFPKPEEALAASGEIVAMVAAGKPYYAAEQPVMHPSVIADAVVARLDQRDADRIERTALVAALGEDERQERAAIADELGEDDREERALLVASLTGDDDDVWMLSAAGVPSTMPPQLQESYVHGKVAKRIRWGVPGDFDRCVAQAKIHGMGHMAKGACATLHKKALGVWPGREGGKSGKGH